MTRAENGLLADGDHDAIGIKRWTASRRREIIEDIAMGKTTLDAACAAHDLSHEELHLWTTAYLAHGQEGLRASRLTAIARAQRVAA